MFRSRSVLLRGAAAACSLCFFGSLTAFVAPHITRTTAPGVELRGYQQPLPVNLALSSGSSAGQATEATLTLSAFSGATLLPAALLTARSMVSVAAAVARHAKAPVSEFGAPSGIRNFQDMAFIVASCSISSSHELSYYRFAPWAMAWIAKEMTLGFTADIAKNNIGESFYRPWVPFITTIFLFIFVSNWSGAIIPWKLLEIPAGELAAPTNNINTTVALSLLTSIAYFGGGFAKKGLGYFARYVKPTPILLPINILEDFTKPLSLSFRLFGNVLADELTVAVLTFLVPFVIPLPIMALGVFAGSIQALIFSTLASAYIHEALE
ncbi:unnamed protein product [Polarella glacialis]|uniref:ATP synthase subunit a, chloroplastic n=1 Tax=Polarella glacialis TaxID=89957 RepID=A0A813GPF5_POLGL|nr:unnamed protein product [Polarella glacialis]